MRRPERDRVLLLAALDELLGMDRRLEELDVTDLDEVRGLSALVSDGVLISTGQYAALCAVLDLDRHLWFDIATALSCAEIEAVVGMLRAFRTPDDVCAEIITAHGEGDDEGDSHYQGVTS